MGLLDGYKTNKAIAALMGARSGSASQQALLNLRRIGPASIPALLQALAAEPSNRAIEGLLLAFVSERTYGEFAQALKRDDPALAGASGQILRQSRAYDPNRLLDLLADPERPAELIFEILRAQSAHLKVPALLSALNRTPAKVRPMIYQLLDPLLRLADVPQLIMRTGSKEPSVRARMARMLGRFADEAGRDALYRLLEDPSTLVRQAALDGLCELDLPVAAGALTPLLRHPDMLMQGKAVEALGRCNDPQLVPLLVDLLGDESEHVRRGAVEVLNVVSDRNAVEDLLVALRDRDWWVKVRAADALGSIGGPRVVEAVMQLIQHEDEFLRRTAIEILNVSQDPRAFDRLVAALDDEDWWVRERAIDALAALGDDRALPYLQRLFEGDAQTARQAIRAMGTLGNAAMVPQLLLQLRHADPGVRRETLTALGQLTAPEQTEMVTSALTRIMDDSHPDLQDLARETMHTLVLRREPAVPPTPPTHERVETPFVDAAALRPGEVLGERYRVSRHVGKGGFGVAVLVHDTMVNDDYVLKFLNPQLYSDPEALSRFTQELRYARKITHQNVIRIYDLITFGRSHAISMEYFPSHSLAAELAGKKGLPLMQALAIGLQISGGMAAAQACQVVHRDLKPANILLNDDGKVKIVDFGLAAGLRADQSRITRTGILVGTPTYMAPEQARGQVLDARTDIYSLGVILYEMIAGQAPYRGGDPIHVLMQHAEGRCEPLREHRPEVPDRLNDVVMRALAVQPEARYQSFSQLHADLGTLLRDTGA